MLWQIDEHAWLFIEPNPAQSGAGRITLAEPPDPQRNHPREIHLNAMSLSQPSHTIVVEPVRATTTAPAPKETLPPDDRAQRETPAEVAAKA